MRVKPRNAFTIIELLVVITIIVILLALLAPAMDKAIYQAELASCAANMKALGSGVVSYALSNGRKYPYREVLENSEVPQPQNIKEGEFDDREVLASFLSLNKTLMDPLVAEPVDLEEDIADNAYASYMLWFGFGFDNQSRMNKMGDSWTWSDTWAGAKSFNWLATDMEAVNYGLRGRVQTNHQDDGGRLLPVVRQAENWSSESIDGPTLTMSIWRAQSNLETVGHVDYNSLGSDLSVTMSRHVEIRDDRMAYVPLFANYQSNGSAWTWRIPRD